MLLFIINIAREIIMDSKYHLVDETGFEHNFSNLPGIMHDVKNLMCAVINTAELLALETPIEHPCCQKLWKIVQISQQCIELLTLPQSIKKIHNNNLELIELNTLIDDVVSLIEFHNNDISIEVIHDASNPVLSGNKIELESALLNVCINAIESMSENGTLQICVSSVKQQEKLDFCNSTQSVKRHVQIEISDTGIGIAPENIAFIFNPFYTTKQTLGSSQRGLGLFRTKHCICAHGGTIEVQSTLSKGTTFTIVLPVADSKQSRENSLKIINTN
jgi:signal transduction histidine kinase